MECSDAENKANAERAKRSGKEFGEIPVTILEVTDERVRFSTRGEDEHEHRFSVSRDDVWLACPSTAQRPGDTGRLKITKNGLNVVSEADKKTRIKNAPSIELKWPERAGDDTDLAILRLWPTEITIRGYAHGSPDHRGEVTLTDPDLCAQEQILDYSSARPMLISLTPEGFKRFGLPMGGTIEELEWAVDVIRQCTSGDGTGCQDTGTNSQLTYAQSVVSQARRILEQLSDVAHDSAA